MPDWGDGSDPAVVQAWEDHSAAFANNMHHYGAEQTDMLLAKIRPLLQELMSISVDWSKQSWQEAGDYVRDTIQSRHPYLSDAAVGRLRGYFMYQTK